MKQQIQRTVPMMLGIVRPNSLQESRAMAGRFGFDASLMASGGITRLPLRMEIPPGRSFAATIASVRTRLQSVRNGLRQRRRETATATERETAYHEAGHAVIDTVHGIEVFFASVKPERNWLGAVWPNEMQMRLASRETRLACTVAGALAVCIGMGTSTADVTIRGIDETNIIKELGTGWYRNSPAFKAALRSTEWELRNNWRAVETIARMLLGDVELDGSAVRETVRNCGK